MNQGAVPPPRRIEAVIFDMDGVVTRTAHLHAAAWKEMFDEFLQQRARAEGKPFRPFDVNSDYLTYVDGKPRNAGVESFISAREIRIPLGEPDDPQTADTIYGLAKRKDALFDRLLKQQGVSVFPSSVALIEALRAQGLKTGIVTSSRHGRDILTATHLANDFDARIDGKDAEMLGLRGKPEPDAFVRCAELLGTTPAHAIVIEDAVAGVDAARRGGFAAVIGVNRGHNQDALAAAGATRIVADLEELPVKDLLATTHEYRADDIAWRVEQEGFDPAREHAVESIFTVGNGYLGVRGALYWPLPISQDDLFIAGIYDRKQAVRPYSEQEFLHVGNLDYPYTELVSAPFPFRLHVALDGTPLNLADNHWRAHKRVLDLHHAVLLSEVKFETQPGLHTTVRTRRCATLTDRHLLLQEISVCLENFSGIVDIDTSISDPNLAVDDPHLVPVTVGPHDDGVDVQHFTTRASGYRICIASRTLFNRGAQDGIQWRLKARIGDTFTLRRFVAVYTSRDVIDPEAAAIAHLRTRQWDDFDTEFGAHAQGWRDVWTNADIRIDGSAATEQALRFDMYHLTSAADRDPSVSVGARALTGRAYEGHVFWDVEIFMLPFYLHTQPEIARSLLLYRHHTLDGARNRAQALGFRGASYAWESTVTGEDVTPTEIVLKTTQKSIPIFTGTQQVHVTADVAYGVWRYFDATQDTDFMRDAGAEILIETARYWVMRAAPDSAGVYHIRGVVGPDEYHHNVDDNSYTNWMARFNLQQAVCISAWMRDRLPNAWNVLVERIGLTEIEQEAWSDVAHRLYFPQPRQGVIEQFAGFFDLGDYALPKEERYKAPINRLFDWDRINRLKLIKQADVLMLPFLFPQAFTQDVVFANYRYYEPLTDHGSSLSPSVHACIAARLGLRADAERYWRQSLWLDLSNVMGNSALGVHAACMGGNWQALVFGFLGVRFSDDGPVADAKAGANWPSHWHSVRLQLLWRGRRYPISVARTEEA